MDFTLQVQSLTPPLALFLMRLLQLISAQRNDTNIPAMCIVYPVNLHAHIMHGTEVGTDVWVMCVCLPGAPLSGLGGSSLLEEGAAVFEVLVVLLPSRAGEDPAEAAQVAQGYEDQLLLALLLSPGAQRTLEWAW